MTRYLRPIQLTSKLQDRKCEEGALKPDIKILDALEDISDGEVSSNKLKEQAAQHICHGLQFFLYCKSETFLSFDFLNFLNLKAIN